MSLDVIEEGDVVPPLTRRYDPVDLFMFSAAAWLVHRIHYDRPYAVEVEGHPELVIQGPLQGVMLGQALRRWIVPGARLTTLKFRHLKPAYLGEKLSATGRVTGKDPGQRTATFELWVQTEDESRTTVGEATVQFPTHSTGPRSGGPVLPITDRDGVEREGE